MIAGGGERPSPGPPPRPDRPPRIAVFDGAGAGPVDPAMRRAVAAAAEAMARAGAEISPYAAETVPPALVGLHDRVMAFEAARALEEEARDLSRLSEPLQELIERGRAMPPAAAAAALDEIARLGAEHRAGTDGIDAVLAPAACGSAPLGLASTGSPAHSRAWQALGLPVVCLPAGRDDHGLPVGIQLVGEPSGDARLLDLGAWAGAALAGGTQAHAHPAGL